MAPSLAEPSSDQANWIKRTHQKYSQYSEKHPILTGLARAGALLALVSGVYLWVSWQIDWAHSHTRILPALDEKGRDDKLRELLLILVGACLAIASYLGAVRLAIQSRFSQERADAVAKPRRMLAMCAVIEMLVIISCLGFFLRWLGVRGLGSLGMAFSLLSTAVVLMIALHIIVGTIQLWFWVAHHKPSSRRPAVALEGKSQDGDWVVTAVARDVNGQEHKAEAMLSLTPGETTPFKPL